MDPTKALREIQACGRACTIAAYIVSPLAVAGLIWLIVAHS